MKSEKTAKGYQPTAGIETQVSVGHVTQAGRDAFWLSTLGGDPYLAATKGAEYAERADEGSASFDRVKR
jgi:hypothetical protein